MGCPKLMRYYDLAKLVGHGVVFIFFHVVTYSFKTGDEQISFNEHVDRMQEGKNGVYPIAGKFLLQCRRLPSPRLCMVDPIDESAGQQLKAEFALLKAVLGEKVLII